MYEAIICTLLERNIDFNMPFSIKGHFFTEIHKWNFDGIFKNSLPVVIFCAVSTVITTK